MDDKELDFILNDALNKALMSKDKIKGIPSSNKVADFVNKYTTENKQALQLLQTDVSGKLQKCGKCEMLEELAPCDVCFYKKQCNFR